MAKPKNDPEHAAKKLKAVELRKAGASYDEIARVLGYGARSGAFKIVQTALKEMLREPVKELRSLEAARLDDIQLALWSRVKRGELAALDRLIKIMERRAKLLGLDVPSVQQIEHKVEASVEPEDVKRMAAEVLGGSKP